MASCFSSLKDLGHDIGFCGFLLLGGGGGCGEHGGCMAGAGQMSHFLSTNRNKNQNIKLNEKTKEP